jgi:MoxR-like ATPase
VEAVEPLSDDATTVATRIVDNVATVLRGKRDIIELAVTALLARGHLLVEDVPGVGKTTLARSLARSIGVRFGRIQFTSDMMPADVLGGSIYDPTTGSFDFRPGPVFTQVLLADEINRTTPKTQSALLEAMDERQISMEGATHRLEEPFFVVATQNPEEFYGTYPLPESQLDRFLVRTRIGYPSAEIERAVLRSRRVSGDPAASLRAVVDRADVLSAQESVDHVRLDDLVLDYLHAIVLGTRQSPALEIGASTRAAIALERATRARALVDGRAYSTCDDVKALAVPVLAHRVRVSGAHEARTGVRGDAERVVRDLIATIPVPI